MLQFHVQLTLHLACVLFFANFGIPVRGQMTEDKKRQLLDLHNELRDKIRACEVEGQPPAKQMGSLVWNEQLANKAQNLADQCRVGHDSASDRQVSNWQWVGQNWAGSPDIQSGVQMWIDEHKYYIFDGQQCTQGMCGHYTQMVWADTTDVGCGVADCSGVNGFTYGLSIVCNYGPGGNMNGGNPYERGTNSDCSTAPIGSSTGQKYSMEKVPAGNKPSDGGTYQPNNYRPLHPVHKHPGNQWPHQPQHLPSVYHARPIYYPYPPQYHSPPNSQNYPGGNLMPGQSWW